MIPSDTQIAASAEEVRALSRALEAQVPAAATSLDGLTFTLAGPVSLPLRAGGYVTIETPLGSKLGQIRELAIDTAHGPDVMLAVGGLKSIQVHVPFDQLAGSGSMLEAAEPFHAANLAPAEASAVEQWSQRLGQRRATLAVGHATLSPGVSVELDAGGFERHTFLCGQSGSGKSYALGLVLEQLLLRTRIPIVVLDPNSDATQLRELRPGVDAAVAERWSTITDRIAIRGVGRSGEERLRLRFFDLDLATQEALLGLDPLLDRSEFDALRTVLEAEAGGRSPADLERMLYQAPDQELRALALRIRNLGVLEWSIWSRVGADHGLLGELDHPDWRCLVVDLGSIAKPAERALVAVAVLSKIWARRAARLPVLLVIDEAHNVCPPRPEDPLSKLAADLAVTIAGEGRKFGIHLLVATQRPLKVHENVVSQCDNLFLMRMNSAGDLARVAELFSFAPPGLLERATTFGLGQALICGKVASHPTFVTTGARIAREGGADAPADWAERAD